MWQDIAADVYTQAPPPALAKVFYQGILAAAAGDVPTAGERLRASLVVHDRLRAIPYIAASQAALADLLLAQGNRDEARRLAHQATETSRRIGAWGIARAADAVLAQT